MKKPWLKSYPPGVPETIDAGRYSSLTALFVESFKKYADRNAFTFMGKHLKYSELDHLSSAFASYLHQKGLRKGDRVAVMMPNVPQYPVVAAGVFKAGMVLVNINPLYTPRELEHQLKDSGTKLIVILENFAGTLQAVKHNTPCQEVVLASVGDMLGSIKGRLVNFTLRHIRKAVRKFDLPGAVGFNEALAIGETKPCPPVFLKPSDIAILQYTGGTTGVSKGATLLHSNLVANVLQSQAWYQPGLQKIPNGEPLTAVCALPLYHIYAFSIIMLMSVSVGGRVILIPNPRDLTGTLDALVGETFHAFPGVNTLFNALARHEDFGRVNWNNLKLTPGAGMATLKATADLWRSKTGCAICEGYGLSETSPMATANPVTSTTFSGNIGLPVPSTELTLLDEAGNEVALGEPGEIAIRGPQVMAGYWNRPEETAKVMTADGYLKTGDIGVMNYQGYFKIVDRKKDMILVSGFNVYPNEIEDVVTQHPGVSECAAIGVKDERSGETVKVFVVKADEDLTEADVRKWCDSHLTPYKRPKTIVFAKDLPKSPVGKVLRRELRDKDAAGTVT